MFEVLGKSVPSRLTVDLSKFSPRLRVLRDRPPPPCSVARTDPPTSTVLTPVSGEESNLYHRYVSPTELYVGVCDSQEGQIPLLIVSYSCLFSRVRTPTSSRGYEK